MSGVEREGTSIRISLHSTSLPPPSPVSAIVFKPAEEPAEEPSELGVSIEQVPAEQAISEDVA